jgi:hypothetical protein
MKLLVPLLPLLLATSCAHLAQVEQGILAHHLAGSWNSERGDHLLIGCAGSFNADHTALPATAPFRSQESSLHISEIAAQSFKVSQWPQAATIYSVERWPSVDQVGHTTMKADGLEWVRVHEIRCD